MYARQVDDRVLTFAVSGMLWKRSLIMNDMETESLWSHLLGTAQAGPLKGKQLKQIPAAITDWKSWKRDYPQTTFVALGRTSKGFNHKFFEGQPLDRAVLGIAADGKAKAWQFDALAKTPVHQDVWQDEPVVVLFDASSYTARLFSRRLDGRTLEFEATERGPRDTTTGSHWNATAGVALDGPLAGKRLTAMEAFMSYRGAWRRFHSESTFWPAYSLAEPKRPDAAPSKTAESR